ncbi:MAG: hypothetical protein QNI89_08550, partial [Desulfobacterales bacterium]|nr:hypothetical protein [Desulfobacterales bacterium]
MAKAQPNTNAAPDAKINEAEVCFSMGLFIEALSIYEQVLKEFPDLESEKLHAVEEKIVNIKKEIEEKEKDEAGSVSSEEISMLKKSLSGQEDIPAIVDSASAFKDLGLFEEALAEFEKLLVVDHPPEKIVPEMADCLLKLNSPNELLPKIQKIVDDQRIATEKRGRVQFLFGEEMEKRDHRDLSLDLYEESEKNAPEDEEIQQRLEQVRSRVSSGSKYDYLLRQNLASTDQLQQAANLSKQQRKSVEAVLMDNFGVSKDDIAKSFSQFYGC